ncbi:TPA: hypothetical protein R8T42_001610 [Campylobacter jejuni]|nr:hypothetical protein [Campylobacter jejuni]EAI1448959.1 hypothetical protein [Campylobacter jejuni]EAJ4602024.1 hypothetical protein [Campylobacter jejuni]EDO8118099.1 hypothetical protein [Campylobacter jejuni]ELE7149628.1 hypothetical protein [Campylobacter jejuni]
MIVFPLSSFNRYFGNNPLQTLTKIRDESIENAKHPRWMHIDGVSYDEAYVKIFHTSKSIDEFKEKYLELQKKYFVDFNNIDSSQKKLQETSEEDKKAFKPIQVESKSETYKDDNKMNELLRKLLETKFGTSDELEILFGMNFSNDNAGEFNKILSQNTSAKIIDIKA